MKWAFKIKIFRSQKTPANTKSLHKHFKIEATAEKWAAEMQMTERLWISWLGSLMMLKEIKSASGKGEGGWGKTEP